MPKRYDYSLAQIQQALLAWEIVMMGDTPAIIHLRADILNAIKRLSATQQIDAVEKQAIKTICLEGVEALRSERVAFSLFGTVTRQIFTTLNIDGTF